MIPSQLIASKRDGRSLSRDDLSLFVRGYVSGDVPDYQMAAMAMAIYLRGMDDAETAVLTEEMLRSGRVMPSPPGSRRVDKHSTGGIGDKTSLIIAPLLACCGLKVPMISGRGLGATGGTLDKLESIAGFRTDLSLEEIESVVERVGCVITGATPDLVPADRKLYALRDVTGTVASIPLITASIMSKKAAEGLSALVLDVKFGSGAFMKKVGDAALLAESMVRVGSRMGIATTALLTDMNQPNGRLAGNAVEVDESIDVLTGGGPNDLRALSIELAAEGLLLSGGATDLDESRSVLQGHLSSGRAMEKFQQMVAAQGGHLNASRPRAVASDVSSPADGFVGSVDVEQLGWAIIEMGGGRKRLGERVDHSVGLEMLVRVGDAVSRGQPLVRLFAPPNRAEQPAAMISQAIVLVPDRPAAPPLIARRITSSST